MIGLYRGKWDVLWKHRKSFQLLSWSWAQPLLNYVMFTGSCILRVAARQELMFCWGIALRSGTCRSHWRGERKPNARCKEVSHSSCFTRASNFWFILLIITWECPQFLPFPWTHLERDRRQQGGLAPSSHQSPLGVALREKTLKPFPPPHYFTSEEITVCIYESKPPQFVEVWSLHCISECQAMLAAEDYGLLNLWAIILLSEA